MNPIQQALQTFLTTLFPSTSQVNNFVNKGLNTTNMQTPNLQQLQSANAGQPPIDQTNRAQVAQPTMTPQAVSPSGTPPPAPGNAPAPNLIAQQIQAGLNSYPGYKGQLDQAIPQMAQAAAQYPIFQKNPYLLPAISIVESSAGKNVTRANNPLNWAARAQTGGLYTPSSDQQSIADAITAIGGDPNRGKGYGNLATQRMSQEAPYAGFRQSGDLQQFAKTYEPANPAYYDSLVKALKYFQK